MRIVVYPGTFDPIHRGHIDIAERASKLFDQIIFAVAINSEKNPLFNSDERIELILGATKHIPNVKAYSTDGLIADFARDHNAVALIRGLRHVSDFEFEFQMVGMNRVLSNEIETVFLMADNSYQSIASKLVKEIARLGGNTKKFVPNSVYKRLINIKSKKK